MWLLNNKLKAQYEAELLKQTSPYEYYLKENKCNNSNFEGEHENVPLVCYKEEDIVLFSEDERYKIYECGDYFIYESKKGISSLKEKGELVICAYKLNADLIYADADHIDESGRRHTPFFKPDYSLDTFKCFDMYSEFYAVKKNREKQDIALLDNIAHVRKPLYHYICEENSEKIDALHRNNDKRYLTDDTYADCLELSDIKDKISIIIPSKDNPLLIQTCMEGIKNAVIKSKINSLEVIVVDNGSTEDNKNIITSVLDACLANNQVISTKYIYEPMEFNFSRMCNIGAENASGKYLLFMNDDIEITDELFLLKLLYFARMQHVGAVGCKLLYPGDNRIIQHIGITCMKEAGPSHKLSTFSDDNMLYFGKNRGVHNVLAVTAACLMVDAEKLFRIGGFYDKMKVGYNDVDLCVSLYENGYLNVVNNDCELIHHESISRGSDAASEKKLKRLDAERSMLYERHPFLRAEGDPFYNSNLAEDFLEYRVDVVPDYENRGFESADLQDHVRDVARARTTDKNFHYSFDSVVKSRDYLEVCGWCIANKKKNYSFDSFVVVRDKARNVHVFSTAKINRKDVSEAFLDASYTGLAGFKARIALNSLAYMSKDAESITIDKIIEENDIGVLYINKRTGKKYYAGYKQSDI